CDPSTPCMLIVAVLASPLCAVDSGRIGDVDIGDVDVLLRGHWGARYRIAAVLGKAPGAGHRACGAGDGEGAREVGGEARAVRGEASRLREGAGEGTSSCAAHREVEASVRVVDALGACAGQRRSLDRT